MTPLVAVKEEVSQAEIDMVDAALADDPFFGLAPPGMAYGMGL